MSGADLTNPYEAVLSDLEARKAQLETAIAQIRAIMGQAAPSGPMPPGGGGSYSGATPAHDAFIGLSIPEAAKKHLGVVRRKLSTQELITALEAGGLPPCKYGSVYAVLSRRQSKVGDIVNLKGDWALAEWYPNYRVGKTQAADSARRGEAHDSGTGPEKAADAEEERAKSA